MNMEISAKYDPSQTEDKWYAWWQAHKFFHSEPDGREPYTIVIPPPNVTGVLHMGHMMNNTLQDVLIRRARMLGKNALWVPGTDHASSATEAKVVGRLAEKGIRKQDLSREEFLGYAWDWTHEHGGIILKQLRRLGASCDWDRTSFTMDDIRSESVLRVFCDLYDKGLIYRGLCGAWAPAATGTAPPSRWTTSARKACCASSATSMTRASSTAACGWSTGIPRPRRPFRTSRWSIRKNIRNSTT